MQPPSHHFSNSLDHIIRAVATAALIAQGINMSSLTLGSLERIFFYLISFHFIILILFNKTVKRNSLSRIRLPWHVFAHPAISERRWSSILVLLYYRKGQVVYCKKPGVTLKWSVKTGKLGFDSSSTAEQWSSLVLCFALSFFEMIIWPFHFIDELLNKMQF